MMNKLDLQCKQSHWQQSQQSKNVVQFKTFTIFSIKFTPKKCHLDTPKVKFFYLFSILDLYLINYCL